MFLNLESEKLGFKWDETGVFNVSATRMWGQQPFYNDL